MIGRRPDHKRAIVQGARPSKFAHIVIHTGRFEEMQHFYRTLLLARSAYKTEAADFLCYDEEHHRVVLVNQPGFTDAPPRSNRTHHIAFTYRTLGELFGTWQRLAAEGIEPVWCINHGITTSIYYADPDGTLVETQFDNMESSACDMFLASEYFARNPIGVDFDPVLLQQRYLAGDPLEDLIRQGSAPYPDDVEPPRPAGFDYDYRGKLLAEA